MRRDSSYSVIAPTEPPKNSECANAAPTAVSSYPLAVSMDADPELAGQMVIFTTVCCLPTFFLWVMAMSSFGLF